MCAVYIIVMCIIKVLKIEINGASHSAHICGVEWNVISVDGSNFSYKWYPVHGCL
jgi:hypothetical protein